MEDQFWVFATEGEAALLREKDAVPMYEEALSLLGDEEAGMAQSAYNQVCRLCWALGRERVQPVLDAFQRSSVWHLLEQDLYKKLCER